MRRVASLVTLLLACGTSSSEFRTIDASTTPDAVESQCTGSLPTLCIASTPCPPTLAAARAPNALCTAAASWLTQEQCGGYTVIQVGGIDTSTAFFYDANGGLAGVADV